MEKVIMAVDDSASIRQMLAITLKNAGCNVVEAVDGQDALDKLDGSPVHMLICDVNMPNMDGIELVRRVRAHPAYQAIPIVLLTTESEDAKTNEGKSAGATGWIVKPFQPDQLLSVVEKVLE